MRRTDYIVRAADRIVRAYDTRNPRRLAERLGLRIIEGRLGSLKGMYKIIERNRFLFLNEELDAILQNIVLLHEIGHDQLHRKQAGAFQEFNLFDMATNQMEYEANLFAAQVALPDDAVLDHIREGHDVAQIATAMRSNINLVAIKVSDLASRGYKFQVPEHKRNFLA